MADRIVQLQNKDGENIYPIGANLNEDPEFFTMFIEGVDESSLEFVSPKKHHYQVVRRNGGTLAWIESSDFDLSKINCYRQTFQFTSASHRPNYMRMAGPNSIISSYMGRMYDGAGQAPLSSTYTGETSASGYWQYVCDCLAVTATAGTGGTTFVGEATYIRQDGGWQAMIQYHIAGVSTGGRVCSEIKTPNATDLPLIYVPSATTSNMNSAWNCIEILEPAEED